MTLPKLEAIVAKTNAAKPDVIVLLGDYVIQGVKGGRFVSPEESARVLAGLKAPLGVWAVLGNHDWWLDGERVQRALEGAGISVLEDEAKPLSGRGPLWVAGLGDLWTRQADIAKALRRVPEKHPVLLLTHNPDVFPGVPAGVSLTLAGHTHGGQVALPFLGRPIVPSRYKQRFAYGLIEEDDRLLFVTGGLGTSILPVRFRVPPEVVVLTLRRRRLP
jgi:predicted MPP superfamily phosphohydrolase